LLPIHLPNHQTTNTQLTPCWTDCDNLAAQAAANGARGPGGAAAGGERGEEGDDDESLPTGEQVASEALTQLHQGLEDGSVQLGSQYLF